MHAYNIYTYIECVLNIYPNTILYTDIINEYILILYTQHNNITIISMISITCNNEPYHIISYHTILYSIKPSSQSVLSSQTP